MVKKLAIFRIATVGTALSGCLALSTTDDDRVGNVQVGPRPYFLVGGLKGSGVFL
jgi:hypothetical protein